MSAAVGVALGLGSAVAHTWWNVLAKRMAGTGIAGNLAYTAAGVVILAPVFLVVLLTTSAALTWTLVGAAAVSAALHAGYGVLVQESYRHFDLTAVYPLSRGIAPVLVALASLAWFGQLLSWWQWLGVLLMTAVIVFGADRRGATDSAATPQNRRGATSWALAIGATIAAYTTWDGWAVLHLRVDPVLYYGITGTLQFVVIAVVARRRISDAVAITRSRPGIVFGIGVLIPISYLLALIAVRSAPVAVVAAARGTTVLWASLVAALFLGEHLSRRRAVVITIALGAIVLLAV